MLLRIVHRLGRRTASAATISSCRRITALHSWAMNIFRSRWCSSRFRYSVWIIWIVLQLMEDCSGCVSGWLCAERTYRVLGKFQIGEPGCGRNPGLMRNCLSNSAPFRRMHGNWVSHSRYRTGIGDEAAAYEVSAAGRKDRIQVAVSFNGCNYFYNCWLRTIKSKYINLVGQDALWRQFISSSSDENRKSKPLLR